MSLCQGSETNIRPSAENAIGLTPGPTIWVVMVPSGAIRPTSPVNIAAQYMEPSGPKLTSSGPITPCSGPYSPTIWPAVTSSTATPPKEQT